MLPRRVTAAQLTHALTAMEDDGLAAGRGARQEGLFQLLRDQFCLNGLQPHLQLCLLCVESDEFDFSGDLGHLSGYALSAFLLGSAFDLEIANRPRPQLQLKPQLHFRNAGVPPALLNYASI